MIRSRDCDADDLIDWLLPILRHGSRSTVAPKKLPHFRLCRRCLHRAVTLQQSTLEHLRRQGNPGIGDVAAALKDMLDVPLES